MKLDRFYDQLFFCTTRIVVPAEGADNGSVGTGFLVTSKVTSDRQVILLVSNKHVFMGKGRRAQLSFHRSEGDPATAERRPLLGQATTVEVMLDQGYTEHPDPGVDLACLNVSGIGNPEHGIYVKTLADEMGATFDEPWLMPFNEVCFVGYPDGRHDTKNHLPILRSGRIASIPQTDFNGIKQLVIDAHVHRGSSGSPVFAIPPRFSGQDARFIGVLTQTMIRGEQLQTIAAVPGLAVPLTIGLGLVLKVDLVRELIAAAVAKVKPLPPIPANDVGTAQAPAA